MARCKKEGTLSAGAAVNKAIQREQKKKNGLWEKGPARKRHDNGDLSGGCLMGGVDMGDHNVRGPPCTRPVPTSKEKLAPAQRTGGNP